MTVMKTQGIQQAPTYGPGYRLHTISDVDHGHHGKNDHATQTAQPERKSIGCAVEERNVSQGRRAMEK